MKKDYENPEEGKKEIKKERSSKVSYIRIRWLIRKETPVSRYRTDQY